MPLGPSSVGPYSITRELGHGGMGVVYLARDTRLDRQVAIKALPAHLAADPDRLGRFEREAKVLASLSHPGIAAIYGLEEANSQRYLVLEFVEGESLAQRLERGPMPVDEALDVARQIALALEAAHEKGVIHRDLKPGNVMVTPEGVVKVLDFGLARTADGAPSASGAHAPSPDSPTLTTPAARPAPVHSPTVPGVIMGTAGYMSPEQARGKPVDKRSDIFSFGCVLYEMLSGAGPFPGETVTDSLGAILHREPDWALLPPGTSTRVRDLLVRCLAKDRRNRLHDIADARIELERAIAGHDWGTAAGARGTRAGFPSVPVALVAAAALIAVGAGLWRALAPRAGPTPEPVCVAVPMPADARVEGADITPDGRTLVVRGKPRATDGAGAGQWRAYTRELGTFDFKPLAGSDDLYFMRPTRDSRGLIFVAPASPGSSEERCMLAPLDGGSPPTPIVDWKDEWADFLELASGDLLILDDASSLIRLTRATGALTPPMKLDAGRPGVVRFEFSGMALPGDRGALVNVVSYGSKGFQHSVGVLDFTTGRVKVIVEDGGNAALSPTGHLVFARGDVALAAPFDPEATEVRGSPVAVWGGLPSPYSSIPGWFRLTDGGALMYQPSPPGGWNETISVLSEGGKLEPWWSDRHFPKSIHPSPDGSRALLQLVNARNIDELWVSPVSHADLVKLSAEANADSFSGVWAPDGKRIAYTRIAKDDADGVYIQTVDGGEPRRVLKFASAEQPAFPTAWLPDGSTLLINVRDAGRWTIRRLALRDQEADAGALTPFLPSESNRIDALLSRDGRLLAFASDETGKFQNWVAEIRPGGEPGRPVQIKTLGSRGHAWAPDGRTLYVQDERGRLMKLTVEVEPALSVSSPVEVADFERLGVRLWQPLSEGRFFVGLRHEGWSDIKHFNLALNWTETLKERAKAK